jgi:hypothetical protein
MFDKELLGRVAASSGPKAQQLLFDGWLEHQLTRTVRHNVDIAGNLTSDLEVLQFAATRLSSIGRLAVSSMELNETVGASPDARSITRSAITSAQRLGQY